MDDKQSDTARIIEAQAGALVTPGTADGVDSGAETTSMFKKIHREATLSGLVSDQIQKLIVDNHLHPGDRLPAERDLALQLGVSRTVVREAVRSLAAKGLVHVSQGRAGTTVSHPSAKSMTTSMTLFLRAGQPQLDYEKLIEVRRTLEIEIAGLAAERRTAEDMANLDDNLREFAKVSDDREQFARYDTAFHAALARATHNDLFILLLDSINEVMVEGRRLGFDVSGTAARAYRYHSAIFKQVKAGNVEGARNAMRDHLAEAADTMRKALALQTSPLKKPNT